MTGKTIAFKQPKKHDKAAATADEWVQSRGGVEPGGITKRLVVDLDEEIHRHVKAECARRGLKMSVFIRELLEREFGAPKG